MHEGVAQVREPVRSVGKSSGRMMGVRAGMVASCLVGIACKREAPPPSPTGVPATAAAAHPPAPAAQTAPRPPGRGAQVIVDSSESLAGFVASRPTGRRGRRGTSTRMSALHQHVVERALAQLNANAPFRRCLLDATLHCDAAPVSALAFDDADTYGGADAALDHVLRRPVAVARPDARTEDPLDPFALTVLITDGFQSTVSPGGGASPDVHCAGGADPACLGSLLAARVREGYGVWLVRIVMPFAGTYFPERPVGEMWPRIAAHVEDLNRNHPEWTGVTFRASRGHRDSPSGAFRWEGARPLLMFVLSRDIPLGRNFVAKVTEFLPTEDTIFARSAALDVASVELAPFEGASARIQEASIRRSQSGGAADAVHIAPAGRTARGVQVSARCSLAGVASFQALTTFQRGARIPAFVDVVPSWRVVTGAAAWLSPAAVPGTLNLNVGIDCRRLPRGTHTQTLGVHVDWRRNAQLAQQWFMRESAETSYEAPESVYRLREIVTPPLVASTDRRGWLDQMQVSVTRE